MRKEEKDWGVCKLLTKSGNNEQKEYGEADLTKTHRQDCYQQEEGTRFSSFGKTNPLLRNMQRCGELWAITREHMDTIAARKEVKHKQPSTFK